MSCEYYFRVESASIHKPKSLVEMMSAFGQHTNVQVFLEVGVGKTVAWKPKADCFELASTRMRKKLKRDLAKVLRCPGISG